MVVDLHCDYRNKLVTTEKKYLFLMLESDNPETSVLFSVSISTSFALFPTDWILAQKGLRNWFKQASPY